MGGLLDCVKKIKTGDKKKGKWIEASKGEVPPNAFIGGKLSDEDLYVVRANHTANRVIPGYLRVRDKAAYVSYNLAHRKENYEVLCNASAEWVKINLKTDPIPDKAIPGGKESYKNEEIITYIGRVKKRGDYILGKIDPGMKRIYYPYDDEEQELSTGEILVTK